MAGSLNVGFLSYEDTRNRADSFLQQFHPDGSLPIPIEKLIEFSLGIDIIPFPELQRTFDVEGFLYSDLTAICVDQAVSESRPARYRFTLAHEVGHVVLHKDIYLQFPLDSIGAWKEFIRNVDEGQYSRIETQAYDFAGLLLVPSDHLRKYFEEALLGIDQEIQDARIQGFSRERYLDYVLQRLAERLVPIFEVSSQVLRKRIDKDNLSSMIP